MPVRGFALLSILVMLAACDRLTNALGDEAAEGTQKAEAAENAAGQEKAGGEASAEVEAKVEEAKEELSDAARFDKDIRKKGCELLSPEMVADTFGVPGGELKQISVMGCVYTWKNDEEELEARLMMIRAHKSEKNAARWFENATKTVTKAEAAQQMDAIKARMKEKGDLDTKLKKKAADTMLDTAVDMIDPEGVQYADVEGVGEQARIALGDGGLWVRVDNLTFTVGAYKGKKMPDVDYRGLDPKAMITASKKANKAWLEETVEQRKHDGTKLAKVVVAALDE